MVPISKNQPDYYDYFDIPCPCAECRMYFIDDQDTRSIITAPAIKDYGLGGQGAPWEVFGPWLGSDEGCDTMVKFYLQVK